MPLLKLSDDELDAIMNACRPLARRRWASAMSRCTVPGPISAQPRNASVHPPEVNRGLGGEQVDDANVEELSLVGGHCYAQLGQRRLEVGQCRVGDFAGAPARTESKPKRSARSASYRNGAACGALASVTIRPLILIPAQRVSSNMARRIRHHPPANFDSCSTG